MQRSRYFFGGFDQRIGFGRIAQIGSASMRTFAQFQRQCLQRIESRAGQHHDRALGMQCPSDGGADAARCAGYQRGLAVQPEHRDLPLLFIVF